MSLRLGCALSDRIAASDGGRDHAEDDDLCAYATGAAVMINGTSDPVVPYGGGTEHNLRLSTLSAEDSAKAWAKIDRCSEKPEKSKLPGGKGSTETKVDTYTGCQQDAEVVPTASRARATHGREECSTKPEKQSGKTSEDLNANDDPVEFSKHAQAAAKTKTESRPSS